MKSVTFARDCEVLVHPDTTTHMDIVRQKAAELKRQDREDAFFLVDLGDVIKRYRNWQTQLPRAELFYAVKCNDDPAMLKLLDSLGSGFDCASKSEMEQILNMGVRPSRIAYSNPIKQNSYIRFASQVKVDLMAFDNHDELVKIQRAHPNARLVLRILPPVSGKVYHSFGEKFGCYLHEVTPLLAKARELGLNVVGVSFHCGSGVAEGGAFRGAIAAAATVFQEGKALGFDLDLLDLGGGFPSDLAKFEKVAGMANEALDEYFPASRKVRIIGEPGRYMAEAAFTATPCVIAKRRISPSLGGGDCEKEAESRLSFAYYVNDGVFGSFSCVLVDNAHPGIKPRLVGTPVDPTEYPSVVYGHTMDGQDRIINDVMLPELQIGDVINFINMGAYSTTGSSFFNGMPRPLKFYHCCESLWNQLSLETTN